MTPFYCKCLRVKVTKEESVYIKISEPFENLLKEMFPQSEIEWNIPNIYYEKIDDSIKVYSDNELEQFFDLNNFWDIMFVIEEYVQTKFAKLALHGGAIAKGNNAIAFVQARKKGKSTLVRALLSNKEYHYISDDLLLVKKNTIAGVASPIRVRDKLEDVFKSNGKYIGSTIDETGEVRNIFVPYNERKVGYIKLLAIVLPQYSLEGKNTINTIKGTKKFLGILQNLKEYYSVDYTYNEIVDLCNQVSVYCLEYSDINFAQKEVAKIWRNEYE